MLKSLFLKSLAFHALLIPIAAVSFDLGLRFIEKPDIRVFPVAAVLAPSFYLILFVPALLHGGVFWSFKWMRERNPLAALFLTVVSATGIYFIWFHVWGGRIKDEITSATSVMVLSSLFVSSIATFKIKKNSA